MLLSGQKSITETKVLEQGPHWSYWQYIQKQSSEFCNSPESHINILYMLTTLLAQQTTSNSWQCWRLVCFPSVFFVDHIFLSPLHVVFIWGSSFMPATLRQLLWSRVTSLKPEHCRFRSSVSVRSVSWRTVWHRGTLSHINLPVLPNPPPPLPEH